MTVTDIRSAKDLEEHLCNGGWVQIQGRQVNPKHIVSIEKAGDTFEVALSNGETLTHDPFAKGDVGDLYWQTIEKGQREEAQKFLDLVSHVWAFHHNDADIHLFDSAGEHVLTVDDMSDDLRDAFWHAETETLFAASLQSLWSIDLEGNATEIASFGGTIEYFGLAYDRSADLIYAGIKDPGTNNFARLFQYDRQGNGTNLGDFDTHKNYTGLAIDEERGVLYTGGNLTRIELGDVGNADTSWAAPSTTPWFVYYVPENDKVYYSELGSGGLYQFDLDGTNEEQVSDVTRGHFLKDYGVWVGMVTEPDVVSLSTAFAKSDLVSLSLGGVVGNITRVIPVPVERG